MTKPAGHYGPHSTPKAGSLPPPSPPTRHASPAGHPSLATTAANPATGAPEQPLLQRRPSLAEVRKFLISAPEHDTPRRARAYLVTDEAVTETASRHAPLRPRLDEVSRHALTERPSSHPNGHQDTRPDTTGDEPRQDSESGQSESDALLWAALCHAPAEGVPVADLITVTGMSQRWVFDRLATLLRAGRAVRVRRGYWRATRSAGDAQ